MTKRERTDAKKTSLAKKIAMFAILATLIGGAETANVLWDDIVKSAGATFNNSFNVLDNVSKTVLENEATMNNLDEAIKKSALDAFFREKNNTEKYAQLVEKFKYKTKTKFHLLNIQAQDIQSINELGNISNDGLLAFTFRIDANHQSLLTFLAGNIDARQNIGQYTVNFLQKNKTKEELETFRTELFNMINNGKLDNSTLVKLQEVISESEIISSSSSPSIDEVTEGTATYSAATFAKASFLKCFENTIAELEKKSSTDEAKKLSEIVEKIKKENDESVKITSAQFENPTIVKKDGKDVPDIKLYSGKRYATLNSTLISTIEIDGQQYSLSANVATKRDVTSLIKNDKTDKEIFDAINNAAENKNYLIKTSIKLDEKDPTLEKDSSGAVKPAFVVKQINYGISSQKHNTSNPKHQGGVQFVQFEITQSEITDSDGNDINLNLVAVNKKSYVVKPATSTEAKPEATPANTKAAGDVYSLISRDEVADNISITSMVGPSGTLFLKETTLNGNAISKRINGVEYTTISYSNGDAYKFYGVKQLNDDEVVNRDGKIVKPSNGFINHSPGQGRKNPFIKR